MIRCNNCMTEFEGQHELKLYVEVQTAADDGYIVPYDPTEDYGDHGTIFRGCPRCETDEYLMDMEDET